MQRQNEFKPIRKIGQLAPALAPGLVVILFCSLLNFSPRAGAAQVTGSYWNRVGSPATGRFLHTATLLQNGTALIAGGIGAGASGATPLNSAELYDPATGTWSRTGSLSATRFYHTAVLLTNGKTLVAGGASRIDASGAFSTPLNTAEIYDPATGRWSPAGNFSTARGAHTATLLRDGRVLIAGGALVNVDSTASVEIYNPATGTWSAAASLGTARSSHTACLLADGRVLVAGGLGNNRIRNEAEIYDPASDRWTPTGSLNTARFHFTATALLDGQALAAGGGGDINFDSFQSNGLSSAELYNPATGSWSAMGSLIRGRGHHSATLLPNGQAMVSGGVTGQNISTASAEIFDPATRTWRGAQPLNNERFWQTVTLLPSGQALAVGGIDLSRGVNDIAETFDPIAASGVWRVTDSLKTPRVLLRNTLSPDHSATLLPNGQVLVAGGSQSAGGMSAVEVYDPSSRTWNAARNLNLPRREHRATLLSNGRVLLTGGRDGRDLATNTAEVYDPSAGGSRTANDLSAPSRLHTATLLADGLVLIAGGETESVLSRTFGARVLKRTVPTALPLGRAELYDPAANRFRVTGSLAQARSGHTAVLLPNGKILVAGGSDRNNAAMASAELYDPATGAWSATGSLNTARRFHTATLLPSGKALIAGGEIAANRQTETAEVYDPASGAWSLAGTLGYARAGHSATLLPNGQVLVAGGVGAAGQVRLSEVYDPATNLWGTDGALTTPRRLHTATLLQTGSTLIVGGIGEGGGTVGEIPLNSSELFDAAPAIARRQVIIASVPGSLTAGDKLAVNGSGFTGGLEASSGNAQSSATNYPLLQLRSLSNEQTRFFLPDPAVNWSDTSFTSQAVTGFPRGQALVSVVSNGVASDARSLLIGCAAITLSPSAPPAATACAAYSQIFTAAGGTSPYTFSTPQNRLPPGLQLVRDTLLGTPTQPGTFTISIIVTDANGCASLMDVPLTVNPSTITVRTAPAAAAFGQTDPQRRPALSSSSPASQSSQCFLVENTSCFALRFRLESLVRTNGERISDANDLRSSSPSAYERNPYLIKQTFSTGGEIAITPSNLISLSPGEQVRLCVQFDPLIPGRAGRTSALAASQVMPEQITSQLNFLADSGQSTGGAPSRFSIPVNASLNPLVKLIHPNDPSLPSQVTLARAGDEFTVDLAIYDPNMDVYLIRYQFLDSAGNQVEPNVDVDMAEAIGRAGLARGQSFGVTQRFQGASQRSDVARVRVTIYDRIGEESAVSVPASSFSIAANSRSMEPRTQGVTLELPARTLAPSPATTRAIVRDPQPATRRRRR